jgi:hypothetical protein
VITRDLIVAPDPRFLSQGDLVANCWIRQPSKELRFLQKLRNPNPNRPEIADFRSSAEPPNNARQQLIVAEAQLADVVLVSYSCDIDDILERIARGDNASPSEVCFVAPTFPLGNYHRIADDVRRDAVENLLLIEESEYHPECVVDFSFLQFVGMRPLLMCVPAGRRFSLTGAGSEALLRKLARFLGDEDRRAAVPYGRDDDTLLERSLRILG